MFRLQFPRTKINYWASRYDYPGETTIVDKLAPKARGRGHLTKLEFLRLCEWKSPRTRPRCASNSDSYVQEITRTGLGSHNERLKIEILTLLSGVSWPTASVILHFCDRKPYPILDFRALWSVGAEVPRQYSFSFWWDYVRFVRRTAKETGSSMRTIDRALWQYSKEHQRRT